MYLDFEDYRPDIQPIGRAISWREGVLLSIIAHLAGIIVLLVAPRFFPFLFSAPPRQVVQLSPQDTPRIVEARGQPEPRRPWGRGRPLSGTGDRGRPW